MAVLVAAAGTARGSPVIDDEALMRGCVRQLGELADAGSPLSGAAVAEGAAAVRGLAVTVVPGRAAAAAAAGSPLYDAVLPAVVALATVYKCEKCSRWHDGSLASGWIATPDGLVVTNHHCLELPPGHRLGAMTSDGRVHAVTEVVAVDPDADLAVVRIDTGGRQFPFLELGDAPACGTEVAALGHPGGRLYCLTKGIVSRYHRHRRRDQGKDVAGEPRTWMSVTAEYAVGASGGPVLDTAGRVVGMVSRTAAAGRPQPPAPGRAAAPAAEPAPPQGPRAAQPDPPGGQMTFRDCVSLESLRGVLRAR